ncbi:hypothetical protein ACWEQC_06560 [Streptomyces shenzhenensis]
MTRIRVAIASILLTLTAVIIPAATAHTHAHELAQARDIGWGLTIGSPADEPTATVSPSPAASPQGDIGWG